MISRAIGRVILLAACCGLLAGFTVVPDHIAQRPPFMLEQLAALDSTLGSGTRPVSQIVDGAHLSSPRIRIGAKTYEVLEFDSTRPRVERPLSEQLRYRMTINPADQKMIDGYCREDVPRFIDLVRTESESTLPGTSVIVRSVLGIRYMQDPSVRCIFLFGKGLYEPPY